MASSDAAFRATATDVKGNPLPPRGDIRPFDFIIIGGGTFGSAVAEHLLFRSTGRTGLDDIWTFNLTRRVKLNVQMSS